MCCTKTTNKLEVDSLKLVIMTHNHFIPPFPNRSLLWIRNSFVPGYSFPQPYTGYFCRTWRLDLFSSGQRWCAVTAWAVGTTTGEKRYIFLPRQQPNISKNNIYNQNKQHKYTKYFKITIVLKYIKT